MSMNISSIGASTEGASTLVTSPENNNKKNIFEMYWSTNNNAAGAGAHIATVAEGGLDVTV